MKITFVLPPVNMSGGIRVCAIYAERLQQRGHQVFAVSPSQSRPNTRHVFRSLWKGQGLPNFRPRLPSHFDNRSVSLHLTEAARPIIDADLPDADVVVATWWETAEWVAALSPGKGAKAYFIQHHEVHDFLPKQRSKATYNLPLHKITISRWLVDLMKTEYGDSQVSWVPNSVDTQQFYAPPRRKQSVPTIGLLYSPTYWKGCDISLRAWAKVAEKIPNLRLIAFGIKPPTPDLPLPKNTRFYCNPPQQRIRDIYSQCDVWLCGSWSEGFHLPPLEAMACRCPVVSTRVGGPIDVIDQGVEGYLVPTGDVEALAERLLTVLSFDDQRWRAMSEAAYAKALSYSWEDATDRFEASLLEASLSRTFAYSA